MNRETGNGPTPGIDCPANIHTGLAPGGAFVAGGVGVSLGQVVVVVLGGTKPREPQSLIPGLGRVVLGNSVAMVPSTVMTVVTEIVTRVMVNPLTTTVPIVPVSRDVPMTRIAGM